MASERTGQEVVIAACMRIRSGELGVAERARERHEAPSAHATITQPTSPVMPATIDGVLKMPAPTTMPTMIAIASRRTQQRPRRVRTAVGLGTSRLCRPAQRLLRGELVVRHDRLVWPFIELPATVNVADPQVVLADR